MSLINFLNPKLKPSVESDAVCEDGYGVSNLIASDDEQLNRGFMAFSVCKPPIEIIFDFPKAIDLKVIKLWNSQGALRSTAFEVHGKHEGIWERVAFVRDLGKDIDSVTFCYQSDYSSKNNTETQPSEKVFFFKTAHKMLSNTNSIKIIIRSAQKCPPVLRKIQIWGLPARSLEKADRELIKSIWNEINYDFGAGRQRGSGADDDSGQRSPSRSIPELHQDSMLKLPEEFLDAITWELMTFPTVLPSGKVVDQSTIDKHSEEEAKWGRMPSDPFTGLEFIQQRKAILNLALKARIEKFLMENSEHFKSVPRTLGSCRVRRSKNRHASQFASLCQQHSSGGTYSSLTKPFKKTTSSTTTLASRRSHADDSDILGSTSRYVGMSSCKRPKLVFLESATTTTKTTSSPSTCTNLCGKLRMLEKKSATSTTSATQTLATATSSYAATMSSSAAMRLEGKSTTTSSSATSNTTSTAISLASSSSSSTSTIDQAIQTALQKITRFSQLPLVDDHPPSADVSCINCQSTDFAYEIQTCHHLVCRDCLVKLTRAEKCICNATFRPADVERYHKL